MAKTLGEQLLSLIQRRSGDLNLSNSDRCSVCGRPLSHDTTQGDRQVVTESDPDRTLVFGLTVLIGLPMLCGGLYLLGSALTDLLNKGSRSNSALVNRCNAEPY
jgi:hypothetical protein